VRGRGPSNCCEKKACAGREVGGGLPARAELARAELAPAGAGPQGSTGAPWALREGTRLRLPLHLPPPGGNPAREVLTVAARLKLVPPHSSWGLPTACCPFPGAPTAAVELHTASLCLPGASCLIPPAAVEVPAATLHLPGASCPIPEVPLPLSPGAPLGPGGRSHRVTVRPRVYQVPRVHRANLLY